jgi:superfamily II DNA helicase RecQ
MPLKFFSVPIRDDGSAENELNVFLRSHRVLAIDRRWVDQGADSFWSICVDYVDAGVASDATRGRMVRGRGKDYKEILSADDFAVFAKLRELRKEMAQAEAVPVYTIFTNEQLAQMVQDRCGSKADLEKVAGVGDARIEKYGPRFLGLLTDQWKDSNEAGGKPV